MNQQTQPYSYEYGGQHPKELIGTTEQRVFVGGHYDCMPIIRFIADCVAKVRAPSGDPFIPIIPYFHCIDPHNVMEEDRKMVGACARAIFDASDLGGQLIEMEEAFRLHKPTLVVFPVREDKNLDPERGRLTLTTCGHPFTSYVTLDELKEKVRVFLLGLQEPRGYIIRRLTNHEQERSIFQIHTLVRDGRHDEARQEIDGVCSQCSGGVLDAWLALALIEQRDNNATATKRALRFASKVAAEDVDKAEIAYYRGLIAFEQEHWEKATREFHRAQKLKPRDPRILVVHGFAFRRRGGQRNLRRALRYMEATLEAIKNQPLPDTEIQQRMTILTKMQATNNLAYYYYERAESEQDRRKQISLAEKALELSEDLPVYHRRLRRRNAAWLHTRGCALLLNAKLYSNVRLLEEAKTILGHARAMGMVRQVEDAWKCALQLTAQLGFSSGTL